MSRASTLARAIGADGALNVADVAGLAAVASSGSASDLSTGTLPIARIADGDIVPAKLSTGAPTWDSAGRVGVKATPNTNWPTSWSIQEWQGGNTVWGVQGQFQMGYNNYYDGTNYRFKATGNRALRYIQTDSGHYWDTSASGTANAAATFETQMQLGHQQTLALRGASPQSGTGISFPATQSASSDANTLDDYEEGTWTPTINLLGTVTYTARFGKYQKIGKYVRVTFALYMSSTDTTQDSSAMLIGGLPFTVTNALGSDYENGSACLLTERMRATSAPAAANTFHVLGSIGTTSLVVVQNNYNSTIANSSYFGSNGRSGYFGGTMYVLGQFTYETSA